MKLSYVKELAGIMQVIADPETARINAETARIKAENETARIKALGNSVTQGILFSLNLLSLSDNYSSFS